MGFIWRLSGKGGWELELVGRLVDCFFRKH